MLPNPVKLHQLATANFGKEYLLWEPETIAAECQRVDGPLRVKEAAAALNAICVLKRNNTPWRDIEAFESVIEALNYIEPDFTEIEGVDVPELYLGVASMLKLREEPVLEFSDEIECYCAAVHLDDGFYAAAAPLTFCNPHLGRLRPDLFAPTQAAMRGESAPEWARRSARGIGLLRAALAEEGLT